MRTQNFLSHLVPSPRTQQAYSDRLMLANMVQVETAYLQALANLGLADKTTTQEILDGLKDFKCDEMLEKLHYATAQDGVVVPALVRLMYEHLTAKNIDAELLHKGMTSQDVMDTAFVISWQAFNKFLYEELMELLELSKKLQQQFGDHRVMAYTRMQPALEIKFLHRLQTWHHGLDSLARELTELRPKLEQISLGGAVGDRRAWQKNHDKINQEMAKILGLAPQHYVWHNLRGCVQDYAHFLHKVTGHNAKIGQDIALMAQAGAIILKSGGSSSAMPDKSNPISAEILVSLGRYNAGLLSAIGNAMIHEQERSGSAWTLEWLTLPDMLGAVEASLTHLRRVWQNIDGLPSLDDSLI